MKTEYIQALSRQRPTLVNEMDPLPIISTMVNKGLLKQRMADYMLPEDVRRQINERMINALPPKGEPAYDVLRDTLKSSGQGFLADSIDKTEKKMKGTTEEAVTENRNLLLQNMQPLPLYRTLVDTGMVKDADVEELLTHDKKKKLNEKLLNYLTTRSNEGHEAFLGVLRECGQGKQADGLNQAAATAETNTARKIEFGRESFARQFAAASNRSSFVKPQVEKSPTSQPAKSPAPANNRKDTTPPTSQPAKSHTPANIREDTKPSKMDTTTTLTKREAPIKDKSPLTQPEQKEPSVASPETKRARLDEKTQTSQDARRSVSPEKYNIKDIKPGTRIRWRETPQSAMEKWAKQMAAQQDAPAGNEPVRGEQTSKDEPGKRQESRIQESRTAPSRAPEKVQPSYIKPQDRMSSSAEISKDEPGKEKESRAKESRTTPSRATDRVQPSSLKPQDKIPSSPGTSSLTNKVTERTPPAQSPSYSTPSSTTAAEAREAPSESTDLDARLDRLFSKLDNLESSLTKKPGEPSPLTSSPLSRPTTKAEEKIPSSYSSPVNKDSPLRISSPASSRLGTSPKEDSYRSPDNLSRSKPDDSLSSYTSSATETPSRTLPDESFTPSRTLPEESFDSYTSPSSNVSDSRTTRDSFQSPLLSTAGTPSEKRQEVSSAHSPNRLSSNLYSKPYSPRTPDDDSPKKTGDSLRHTPTGYSSRTEESPSRKPLRTADTRTERKPGDSSPTRDTITQPFLSPQDEKRFIEKNMDQAADKLEAKLGEVAPTFKSSYNTTISSPSTTKPPEKPSRSSTPKVPFEKVRIEKKGDEPVFKPWNKGPAEATKATSEEDPSSPTYDRSRRQEAPTEDLYSSPTKPRAADETKSSPSVHFSDPLISDPIYDVPRDWGLQDRREDTAVEDSAPPELPERPSPSPTKKTSSFTDLFKKKDKQDEKSQPDKKDKGDNDDEKKRKWLAMFVETIKTKKTGDKTDTKGVLSDSEEETEKERTDVDEGKKEKKGGWMRDVVDRMKQSKSDDELDTVAEVTSDEERAARKDEQPKVADKVKEGARKAASRTKDTADKAVEATKEGANRAAHAASESWKQLIAGMKGRDERREPNEDVKKRQEEEKGGVTKGPDKKNEHRDDALPDTVVVTEDEAGNVTIESDVSDSLDIDSEQKQEETSGWKLPEWTRRSPKLGRKKEPEYDIDMESPVESEPIKEKDEEKKGLKLPNIPDIHLKSADWKFRRDKSPGSTSEDETQDKDKEGEKRTGRKGWKEFFSSPDIRSPDWMKRDRSPHRGTDPANKQPPKEESEKKGWKFPGVNIKSPDWTFGRDKSSGRSSVSASQEDIMEPEEKKEKRRSKPADKETPTKEKEKEENQKRWGMPEIHVPDINFKSPDWFKREETPERAPETESSQKIEEPEEGKDKKWKMPEIHAPNIKMPEWKMGRNKSKENVDDTETSEPAKEKETEEGNDRKWKMPEFKMPEWKMGRNKENVEETKSSQEQNKPDDEKELDDERDKWKFPDFRAPNMNIKAPDWKIRRDKSEERMQGAEATQERKKPEDKKDTKKWNMPEFHAPGLSFGRDKSPEGEKANEHPTEINGVEEEEDKEKKKWKMPEFRGPDFNFKGPDWKRNREKSSEETSESEMTNGETEPKVEPKKKKKQTKTWSVPDINLRAFGSKDDKQRAPDEPKEKRKWNLPAMRAPSLNLRAPGTKPSDEDWPMLARSRRGRDVDDVEKAIYIDRRPREFEDVTLRSADEANASAEDGDDDLRRSAELPQPVADDIKIAAQRLQSTERLLKMLQNMSDKAINHAVKCEPLEDKGQRDLADSMSDLRPEELTRKDNLQLLDKMSEELMYLYKHKDVPTSPVPWCMGFSVTMRDVYTTLMLHAISMKASLGDLDKILKLYREELNKAIEDEQAEISKQKRKKKKKKTKPSSKSKHLERMKDEEEKRLKKKGKKSSRSASKSKDTERSDYYGRDPSFDVDF